MALNFQNHTDCGVTFKSKFVPPSFYLPQQLELFIEYVNREGDCIWISKPARSGEGRGIQIYQSMKHMISEEFPSLTQEEVSNCSITEDSMKHIKQKKIVVSKYIENPQLMDGKKFDLRMYVLVVGSRPQDQKDKVYFYRDGIVRIASEMYSTNSLDNPFIHITNNAINDKRNKIQNETIVEQFGFFSNMYISELKEYFAKHSLDWDCLWNEMKQLVIESLTYTILNPEKQDETFVQCRHRCFQLYGYDILIDDNLHPHLLEVNSMPDLLGVNQSLVLKKNFQVKTNMLANAMNLVAIPITTDVQVRHMEKVSDDDILGDFERVL